MLSIIPKQIQINKSCLCQVFVPLQSNFKQKVRNYDNPNHTELIKTSLKIRQEYEVELYYVVQSFRASSDVFCFHPQ